MPRLTTADYIQAHQLLRHHWLQDVGTFAELSSIDQLTLHAYFQPDSDLGKTELLRHRATVSREQPSLPQQAGRAYARFSAALQEQAASVRQRAGQSLALGRASRNGDHEIVIKTVMRPTPNLKKYARALLTIAMEEYRREQAGQTDRSIQG